MLVLCAFAEKMDHLKQSSGRFPLQAFLIRNPNCVVCVLLFQMDQLVEKLSDSLTLGSSYDIAYLVFSSKVPNSLRKYLRSTAPALCKD